MSKCLSLLFSLAVLAAPLYAKDVYLSVGGSANGFYTDARILNPSYDKDITITARYLPAGNADNSGVVPKTIVVTKRSMAIYDDVVNALFPGSAPLGAIRLTSDDDFVATQRIYADKRASHQAGTLGQYVPGLEVSEARRKGALIQLKTGTATLGSFRTNWGGANPNAVVANVTLKLYDKVNAVVGSPVTVTMQPFGVIGPTNVAQFFGNPPNDLTDSWISFESDQPVFLYGSVVDNGSEDPTFVPASDDSGTAPAPQAKTVTVDAFNSSYTVTPSATLNAGDHVTFIIRSTQGIHGFKLVSPQGDELIAVDPVTSNAVQRDVVLPSQGTYVYFCTHVGCSAGHATMNGTFAVGAASGGPPDTGYN